MGQLIMAMLLQAPAQQGGEEAIKQAIAESIRRGGGYQPGHGEAILVPLAFFAVIALIFWLIHRSAQGRIRARAEFHRQLLDKFASGAEFATFLSSPAGQRLLEGIESQQVNIQRRVMRHMSFGIVFTILGIGVLLLHRTHPGALMLGVVLFSLGVGFLISSAASYRLSKKLGLLRGNEATASLESPH